jgi:hypothetical protein
MEFQGLAFSLDAISGAQAAPVWRRRMVADRLMWLITGACVVWAAPVRAEWTFGAFLGGVRTVSSSLRIEQPSQDTIVTASPVDYRGDSFEAPLYYGYRAGVFPRQSWWGIEGEFIHLKVVADTSQDTKFDGVLRGQNASGVRALASVVQQFSISHGVNLVLVNTVVRKAAETTGNTPPRWILAGRVGAGASVPHPESTIDGLSHSAYEIGSFSAQAALAAELRLTRHLYATGEYKYTHTDQNVSISGGSAHSRLNTHHVVGGFVVHIRQRSRRLSR